MYEQLIPGIGWSSVVSVAASSVVGSYRRGFRNALSERAAHSELSYGGPNHIRGCTERSDGLFGSWDVRPSTSGGWVIT